MSELGNMIAKMTDADRELLGMAVQIGESMADLPPEGRLLIMDIISEGYCRYCGGDVLPCHCENDE